MNTQPKPMVGGLVGFLLSVSPLRVSCCVAGPVSHSFSTPVSPKKLKGTLLDLAQANYGGCLESVLTVSSSYREAKTR